MISAIILCGGIGSRLGALTKSKPKCLIEINSKPFLYYQLLKLQSYGIKKVIISTFHLEEQIQAFIKSENLNLEISIISDGSSPAGTGGAIKNIIQGESDPYFVIYGDTYFNLDLAEVFKQYNPKLDSPLMVIYKNSDKYDISNVKLINQTAFYSKSNPPEGCEYIDYGIGIFQAKHFNGFEGNFDLSAVQEFFSRKYSLQHFVANERFYEIGSLSGLKEFKEIIDHDFN